MTNMKLTHFRSNLTKRLKVQRTSIPARFIISHGSMSPLKRNEFLTKRSSFLALTRIRRRKPLTRSMFHSL